MCQTIERTKGMEKNRVKNRGAPRVGEGTILQGSEEQKANAFNQWEDSFISQILNMLLSERE